MNRAIQISLAAFVLLLGCTGCKTGQPPVVATCSGDLLVAGSANQGTTDIQAAILLQTVWTQQSPYGHYTVKESLEVLRLPGFRLAGAKTVLRSGELELSIDPAGGAPAFASCPGGILADIALTGRANGRSVQGNANALCVRTDLPPGLLHAELSRLSPYPLPQSVVRIRGQLQAQRVGIIPVKVDP
jgi:hypothetical protein